MLFDCFTMAGLKNSAKSLRMSRFCLCPIDAAKLTHLQMTAGGYVTVAGGQRKWASGNRVSSHDDESLN